MAKAALREVDIAFGRAVLLATDALGMSAEGAFWTRFQDEDRWRFFLITSLFDSMGPREIYLRLNMALAKKLSERETREFGLFMASPREAFLKDFPGSICTSIYASEPIKGSLKINGQLADLWIYRFADGMDEKRAKKAERKFKKEVDTLLAA